MTNRVWVYSIGGGNHLGVITVWWSTCLHTDRTVSGLLHRFLCEWQVTRKMFLAFYKKQNTTYECGTYLKSIRTSSNLIPSNNLPEQMQKETGSWFIPGNYNYLNHLQVMLHMRWRIPEKKRGMTESKENVITWRNQIMCVFHLAWHSDYNSLILH